MKKNTLTLAVMALVCTFVFSKAHAQNTSPYWSLAGNSNTSTTSKLGTTNGVSLRFYAGNVQRMMISYSNGNVGIGTTHLPSRLNINAAPGGSPLVAQINGSTRLFAANNGGLSVGSGAMPPANGLYVKGAVGIGNSIVDSFNKLHVEGRGLFTQGLSIRNGGISQVSDTAGYAVFASGVNGGIYAEAAKVLIDDGASEVPRAYRQGTAVTAIGATGIYANGDGGYGKGPGGIGVIGDGGFSGLLGRGEYYGVSGTSNSYVGVVGASGVGVEEPGEPIGVLGQSTNIGVRGVGAVGIFGYGTLYAGLFDGAVSSSESFTTSDGNLKKDIKEFTDAMDIIGKLKPRYYTFKDDAKLASLHLPKGNHYGLIAQDVQEVLPNLVKEAPHKLFDTTTMRVQANDGKGVLEHRQRKVPEAMNISAVNYIELIPIMIKGMQEQEAEIKAKDEKIADLEARLQKIEALLNGNNNTVTSISGAYLEQNTPNPASSTTVIRYHVPATTTTAYVAITNAKGQVVKTFPITGNNRGQTNLNSTAMAAGTYNYTLYVDGKQVDTKRLVIAR